MNVVKQKIELSLPKQPHVREPSAAHSHVLLRPNHHWSHSCLQFLGTEVAAYLSGFALLPAYKQHHIMSYSDGAGA